MEGEGNGEGEGEGAGEADTVLGVARGDGAWLGGTTLMRRDRTSGVIAGRGPRAVTERVYSSAAGQERVGWRWVGVTHTCAQNQGGPCMNARILPAGGHWQAAPSAWQAVPSAWQRCNPPSTEARSELTGLLGGQVHGLLLQIGINLCLLSSPLRTCLSNAVEQRLWGEAGTESRESPATD